MICISMKMINNVENMASFLHLIPITNFRAIKNLNILVVQGVSLLLLADQQYMQILSYKNTNSIEINELVNESIYF